MAQPPSEACRETLCERESACLSLSLACPAAVLYSPLTSLKKPNQFRSSTQKGQKGCTCELYLFDKRNKYFWTRMWCLPILSISFHWFIVSAPKTECCPSLAVCLYFAPQTHKSSTTKHVKCYKSYKSSKSVRNLELKLVPSRAALTGVETVIDTQPWSDFQMWIYNAWRDWLPGYWLNQGRSHTCGFFTNSSCFSHKVKRGKTFMRSFSRI